MWTKMVPEPGWYWYRYIEEPQRRWVCLVTKDLVFFHDTMTYAGLKDRIEFYSIQIPTPEKMHGGE